MRRIGVLLIVAFVLLSAAASAQIPIKTLGVAPWLGKLKDNDDLTRGFFREKNNMINYVVYDLKKANGWTVSRVQAEEMVKEMAYQAKEAERIYISDGTAFKSMGWKSKTGKIMRTANPVLDIGRDTEGFLVSAKVEEYVIEYIFLTDCGNMCLRVAESVGSPPAEIIPKACAECPKCPSSRTIYVGHPSPQIQWRPPVYYYGPRYYSGYYAPIYHHYRPHHYYRPRRPVVQTRPAIQPPVVHTRSPGPSGPGTITR